MEAQDKARYLVKHFGNKANKVVKEIRKAKSGHSWYWEKVGDWIKILNK
jgi:hypothetical protein